MFYSRNSVEAKEMIPKELFFPFLLVLMGSGNRFLYRSGEMSERSRKASVDGRRRSDSDKKMVVRGNRDAMPAVGKIGIAIAISVVGFVASQLRPRERSPPRPTSDQTPSSAGAELEIIALQNRRGCLQEELRTIRSEELRICTAATEVGLSPTSNSSDDEEGFLLPEFNDFVMEELEVTKSGPETALITTMPPEPELKEELMKQEIAHLMELVFSLQKREGALQLQLLNYQQVREHEVAVSELENRLKISGLESKMHMLKIDSLQTENLRLQVQMADYSSAMNELEVAREEIKHLEKKLKVEGDHEKEILAPLHQKISSLEQREQKDVENDAARESKLKRLEELEAEAIELRVINSRLAVENSALARKLESAQMTVSSVGKDAELEAFKKAQRLRKENEKLMKEIEQLQTDRCADVEEMVYLRWLNACLRYELRNYQPPVGKTIARDLSRSLSLNSEEMAKHLILEYANLGEDERSSYLREIGSESSTSGELEDNSADASFPSRQSSAKTAKFLGKLKKILTGKGNKGINRNSAGHKTTSLANSERSVPISTCSVDHVIGIDSNDSLSSCVTDEVAIANLLAEMETQIFERRHNKDVSSQSNSRLSWDVQSLQRLELDESIEEKDIPHGTDRSISCGDKKDALINCNQNKASDEDDTSIPEKAALKKFADALRSSRGISTLNRRSASCRY